MTITRPDVRPEPVLDQSEYGSGKPDDMAAHFYGTVLYDESYSSLREDDPSGRRFLTVSIRGVVHTSASQDNG
jgi:hypothetical protein